MAVNDTRTKILNAFSRLVVEYGYTSTTTLAIAKEAGVNESTIFRNFHDKEGLLDALVSFYLDDIANVRQTFVPSDSIEEDLIRLAKSYNDFVKEHRAIMSIGLSEQARFPEINVALQQLPNRFKEILDSYFSKMIQLRKINPELDIETIILDFVWLNFGHFWTQARFGSSSIQVSDEDFYQKNIRSFARALL
ncbi:TetR/AcrR family transcriptional regulator [Pediococcus claussenii]|uniref:Transcriptional regulator, TetR family n=1 Tax=Pediococcus claussenii (strain ATCC BAA-344 / DSM 14800 / JCM 18046 / KCTC 3811 / LMG 21948 / P06) TaxID=701521 RepID=G8PBB9_PEDCP|nr:TetR/AcrR family transcriptional regulator [Pediococcus claussenii]AEV95908.1 Transcriptional regulator, TetR family [Pediococcus claussenii ATCC BAA-344]ANZ69400.1 hypothetical protein AYR57_03350 [Pediococcus claussenii]ANZ71220.1 hypothetical protein AYR58_03365 [Pediococcus claussenii]